MANGRFRETGLVIPGAQTEAGGLGRRFPPCQRAELAQNGRDMGVDRLLGHEEALGDLCVAQPFGQERQHLELRVPSGRTGSPSFAPVGPRGMRRTPRLA